MFNHGNDGSPLLRTIDLVKAYALDHSRLVALDHVNLTFHRGEFAGLVGPSGSGKTTLLNILGSLDQPTEGSAEVLGHRIETLTHAQAAELRSRHIGFIFQTHNLLPVYTIYENVEFPLLVLGVKAAQRHKAVMEALEWVRLADRATSRPAQLSGGQSQRVAIARAIVKRPAIVLADEPTANLDAANSRSILDTMATLSRDLQTTFVFATHDEKVIRYLRRKIVLNDGKVIEDRVLEPQVA
jgi:putative ABC transport system ATP-binding protein